CVMQVMRHGLSHKFEGEAFRMYQRVQFDIDIQVGPMEAVEGLPEIVDLGNCCIHKIGVVLKRYEVFPFFGQQPKAITLDTGNQRFRLRNICAKHL
ncbi:MAG: hypothetical protein Q8M58_10535, partial [Anaerolineales bacterium]|nr:hypothetical protein [Anaerolineales bacterium]